MENKKNNIKKLEKEKTRNEFKKQIKEIEAKYTSEQLSRTSFYPEQYKNNKKIKK